MPARILSAIASGACTRASMWSVSTKCTIAAPICRYSPRCAKRSVTMPARGARFVDLCLRDRVGSREFFQPLQLYFSQRALRFGAAHVGLDFLAAQAQR